MHYNELAELFALSRELEDDLEGLLQLLCLKTLSGFGIEGMIFLQLDTDGRLKPRSHFGLDLEETGIMKEELPLHKPNPAALAIKEKKVIFIENFRSKTASESLFNFESIPAFFNSMAVFPISYGARVVGSMVALSSRRKLSSPQLSEILDAISITLGSLFAGNHNQNGSQREDKDQPRNKRQSISAHLSNNISDGNNELSERQRLILQMIADGRTNADIADLLGYSESLIRQETIRIYAHLGCSGRTEAALIYKSSLANSNKSA